MIILKNSFRLKESIKAKDHQLIDIEQDRLIEIVKRLHRMKKKNLKLKTEI